MANVDKPSGLVPIGYLNGAPWTGGGRVYHIVNTDDTNAFAIGTPVVLSGTADAKGVPGCTIATAGTGNLVLGAIISGAGALEYGSSYGAPADSPVLIPAVKSRDYYVLVADDPNIIFEVQEDNDTSDLAAVDVGLNCNLIGTAVGTYVSGWELDSSSKAGGATLQMKLLGLAQRSNNAFGTYAKWWCIINAHSYRVGTAGA